MKRRHQQPGREYGQHDQPDQEDVPRDRRDDRPRVRGEEPDPWREIRAVRSNVADRRRLHVSPREIVLGRIARLELFVHPLDAVALHPRTEPASGVAAAGDRRRILEAAQPLVHREPLHDAEPERGAADAAAGETERRMSRGAHARGDLQHPPIEPRAQERTECGIGHQAIANGHAELLERAVVVPLEKKADRGELRNISEICLTDDELVQRGDRERDRLGAGGRRVASKGFGDIRRQIGRLRAVHSCRCRAADCSAMTAPALSRSR